MVMKLGVDSRPVFLDYETMVKEMRVFEDEDFRIVQYGEMMDETFAEYDAALAFAQKHDAYVMNKNGCIVGH